MRPYYEIQQTEKDLLCPGEQLQPRAVYVRPQVSLWKIVLQRERASGGGHSTMWGLSATRSGCHREDQDSPRRLDGHRNFSLRHGIWGDGDHRVEVAVHCRNPCYVPACDNC